MREIVPAITRSPIWVERFVVFLDEAHALSQPAFDSLLKALETQNKAVVILATTEPEKVPLAVRSRLDPVTFHPIDAGTIASALAKVRDAEEFHIDDNAVQAIAGLSGGSYREGLRLLDQVATTADGPMATAGTVARIINTPAAAGAIKALPIMLRGDGEGALRAIVEWRGRPRERADALQRLLFLIFQHKVRGRHYQDVLFPALPEDFSFDIASRVSVFAQRLHPRIAIQAIWHDIIKLWDPSPAETDASFAARADRFTDLFGEIK